MLLRPASITPVEYPLISEAVLDKNFPAVNPPSFNWELRSQAWLHTQRGTRFCINWGNLPSIKILSSNLLPLPYYLWHKRHKAESEPENRTGAETPLKPCNPTPAQSRSFSYFYQLHFVTLSPTPSNPCSSSSHKYLQLKVSGCTELKSHSC